MEYRTLGKTGLKISRMGFGGIPIQKIDEEGTKKLLHTMMKRGINYIDSARGYTVSEQYIGYGLEGIRDKFVLATKSMARTKEAMAADIETSLKNFRTDYIDLYQSHWPKQCYKPGDGSGMYECMLEAKEKGMIRHIGMTNHILSVAHEGIDSGLYETLQFPFSYLSSEKELELVL